MQKTAFIALAIIGTLATGYLIMSSQKTTETAQVSNLESIYSQWKVDYKINVGASEDSYRFKVFTTTYGKIEQHNKLLGRGFDLGLNAFSHLTQEEFSATHLGLSLPVGRYATLRNITVLSTESLQGQADWRPKMNKVQDQGRCGSCWAFSAVGAIEGLHSVKAGDVTKLSEQELVDCSTPYGNHGCNGGLMDSAFKYVIQVGGLATEAAYPYTAADGNCKKSVTRQGKITGFTDVPANSAKALMAALDQHPVAVAIEADSSVFQSYKSGVISGKACGTNLNHGVVAVGYSNDSTNGQTPHYIVRNSWGSSWGDAGHVRLAITGNDAGTCGIHQMSSYPTA